MEQAETRQKQLTKPPGSLGRLEDISIRIAGMTADPTPELSAAVIVTMAADHGIVEQGVSAFPQEVTAQMVSKIANGGAAVNTVASVSNSENLLVDIGMGAEDYAGMDGIVDEKGSNGSRNFAEETAMDEVEAREAISRGQTIVKIMPLTLI